MIKIRFATATGETGDTHERYDREDDSSGGKAVAE